MRWTLCTAATVLVMLAQLQLSESSRASDHLAEQLKILADIRHMPKGTTDAEGFINYERSYARTNRHTGSHTSLEYKVRSLLEATRCHAPLTAPRSARTYAACVLAASFSERTPQPLSVH